MGAVYVKLDEPRCVFPARLMLLTVTLRWLQFCERYPDLSFQVSAPVCKVVWINYQSPSLDIPILLFVTDAEILRNEGFGRDFCLHGATIATVTATATFAELISCPR